MGRSKFVVEVTSDKFVVDCLVVHGKSSWKVIALNNVSSDFIVHFKTERLYNENLVKVTISLRLKTKKYIHTNRVIYSVTPTILYWRHLDVFPFYFIFRKTELGGWLGKVTFFN